MKLQKQLNIFKLALVHKLDKSLKINDNLQNFIDIFLDDNWIEYSETLKKVNKTNEDKALIVLYEFVKKYRFTNIVDINFEDLLLLVNYL